MFWLGLFLGVGAGVVLACVVLDDDGSDDDEC
jgi:hypothetical protein